MSASRHICMICSYNIMKRSCRRFDKVLGKRTALTRPGGSVSSHTGSRERDKSGIAWTIGDQWYFPPSDFIGILDDDDRNALLKIARKWRFDKGEYIFEAGEPANRVYIVKSGQAKIYQISPSGKEVILWFCLPGEIFGLAELSCGAERAIYAQANIDTEILSIERGDFMNFMASHPIVAMNAIDVLSTHLRRLGRSLISLSTGDVAVRLAQLILSLAQSYGNHRCNYKYYKLKPPEVCVDITLTHKEIADMIGASRQTVTTMLNDLKRKGALHWEAHHIHIDSPSALEQILFDHES